MDEQEEARLTEEAKSDPEAFARLYDHFLPIVYGYVARRVGSREEAEDITSRTFEKALRSIKSLKKGTSFKVWLYRIAGNTIIDYYRARGRRKSYSLAEAQDMANGKSDRDFDRVESRISVESMLGILPRNHREALVLHFLEGLSIKEMAQVLQTSQNACYMRVYRATRALADKLEELGIERIDDVVEKA